MKTKPTRHEGFNPQDQESLTLTCKNGKLIVTFRLNSIINS